MAGRPRRTFSRLAHRNPEEKLAKKVMTIDETKTLWAVNPPWSDYSWKGKEPQSYPFIVISKGGFFGWTETYVFPADSAGEVIRWSDLPWSKSSPVEPEEILSDAGYRVVT